MLCEDCQQIDGLWKAIKDVTNRYWYVPMGHLECCSRHMHAYKASYRNNSKNIHTERKATCHSSSIHARARILPIVHFFIAMDGQRAIGGEFTKSIRQYAVEKLVQDPIHVNSASQQLVIRITNLPYDRSSRPFSMASPQPSFADCPRIPKTESEIEYCLERKWTASNGNGGI